MPDIWTPAGEQFTASPESGLAQVETQEFISSRIAEATYDSNNGTLRVTFVRGDERTYTNVPPNVWRGMLTASSVGRYFGAVIGGVYPEGL
jgi:hypothetical protein